MKNTNKKGFTLVELVVVIAVIAILAGVLIATFASVIKRANQSAEVQNIKNAEIAQKADDIIKKIEEANWFGWEDFEVSLVEKLTKAYKENSTATIDSEKIQDAIKDAVTDAFANMSIKTTDLTAEEVKVIVENALGTVKYEGVTEAQVRAIVKAATSEVTASQLTVAQVKAIVNAATTNNLTQDDVARLIGRADLATSTDVNAAVETIKTTLTGATSNLATKEQAQDILDAINNYATQITTNDLDDVITAKALNIRIKNAGLTSANTPYDVVSTIEATDSELKNTILLSIEAGQLGFFVVNEDQDKIINSCGLTITEIKYYHWTFANEVSPILSTYLKAVPETVAPNGVGLDVGKQTVSAINYTNTTGTARNVVIRTNGVETSLTINGYVDSSDSSNGDIIKHFGTAGSVDIIVVANASYHEYGKVAFMEIAKGRAALESGSKVNQIHISTQVIAVAENGTKTKVANTFDQITIALANNIETPKFSRDAVSEIAEGGTLVLALQEGTGDANSEKDYVWLYQQGVIQQMVVTTTDTFDADSKATDYAETSNTYQVADDIANNVKAGQTLTAEDFEVDGSIKTTSQEKVQESGLTESVKEFQQTQAINEAMVAEAIENYPGDYWIDAHANSFAGGYGTQEDPYLVSTPMELALIAYNVNNNIDNGSYAGAYYKITANINLESKAWTGIGTWRYPFHGSIDGDAGNGNVYEIINMHDGGAATWASAYTAYTARTYGNPYGFIGIAGSDTAGSNLSVTNLKFTNAILEVQQGLCVGVVIGYAPHTDDFGKSYTSIVYQNHYITDACKQAKQGDADYYKNAYKYIYYFAEENIWFRYPTYKIGNTYYQGYVGEEGYGNKALSNITLANVSVGGSVSGLDCIGGLIGKAYNIGSLQVSNCNVNANVTATGGRAAGLVGYASYLDNGGMSITNTSIVGNIASSNTSQASNSYATCGVAPDYLAGSRDNKYTSNPNNDEYAHSNFNSSGNSFSGEIWYKGEKKN